MNNTPQFPLYIPSKGRHEYMMTSKVLTEMGVKHHIVVEPQEVELYKAAVKKWNLLTTVVELDMKYKEKYELCDDLGLSKSTGSGPARNFAWDHSIKTGHKWHWIMDDNIRSFRRLNNNEKIRVKNGSIFRAMEDFSLRYENVAMAGPQYAMFTPARQQLAPFILNTRIFSCNLIRNDVPFRWRGRYNEDLIMSIDMLKGGWCTFLFYPFLQEKIRTQMMKGGNTSELYKDGTMDKSRMAYLTHPDVCEITYKYGRWHHTADLSRFKHQYPIKKKDVKISKKPNNYGMTLKVKDDIDIV
jgi:hypothetical protein